MRALVVDDCEDAAVTMVFLLKRFGHEAIAARCGEEALRQAPLFRPDVMLIDLSMPRIDGCSLARQFRRTAEFAETPLVAVSGFVDPEHRTEAMAAGFTEFLAKPYPLEVLQGTMERVAARVNAGRIALVTARAVATQTLQRVEKSQSGLADYWETRHKLTPVSLKKSGISNVLTLPNRPAADELRGWLKNQPCRVGPVFEASAGRFSFCVYSMRTVIGEVIAAHGGFRVEI